MTSSYQCGRLCLMDASVPRAAIIQFSHHSKPIFFIVYKVDKIFRGHIYRKQQHLCPDAVSTSVESGLIQQGRIM